ncbi:glycosyl hydrolase family 43 [Fusarium phyllophilum]|uniref:Glycosyl hydrolase family 43 n=1 Tax=Fusarium phyllophilum TaxID=47803 RepID=A0A8H5K728_9HYPO|nr:glycosyl hydrolase family 43 [Fusarium phyllophilum]
MNFLINFGVLLGTLYAARVEAFQNPIRKPGPDPSVVFANGFYHFCHTRVLRGCNKATPFDCTYTHLADLVPPTGSQGGPKSDFAFSINGTYLEIPGKGRYHVLSIINKDKLQSIAITKFDTTKWTVDGWHVISVPDQPWEKNTTNSNPNSITAVNEAPHASSWHKKGPVFSQANGNYGTGHNCFFRSPDGDETWVGSPSRRRFSSMLISFKNAFHATSNPKGSCGTDRFTLAQKVTFKPNNSPQFGIPQPLSAVLQPLSGE